jgi:histidinol-phosphatase (PHP family)
MSYPRISYHGGHSSELCVHAQPPDTKADLVRAYAQAGFTHVGIVEHLQAPEDRFLYPDEIAAGFTAEKLTERLRHFYLHGRRQLLETEDAARINLAIGIETEYYGENPALWLSDAIAEFRPDFIVASVHHVNNIPIDYSLQQTKLAVESCGSVEELAKAYYAAVETQVEILATITRVPVIVGHLDLPKLFCPEFGRTDPALDAASKAIAAAARFGYAFEVNSRAYKKGLVEPYPAAEILKLIREKGGSITLGDDAHCVADVGLNLDRAASVAAQYFDDVTAIQWTDDGDLEAIRLPLELKQPLDLK